MPTPANTTAPTQATPDAAEQIAVLRRAVEASLLFNDATPWTVTKRKLWRNATGSEQVSKRVLRDLLRAALASTQPTQETA